MTVDVAGTYMDRSIVDFQRSCLAHIEEEQRKANPDTAVIALLCDAVRCSRELAKLANIVLSGDWADWTPTADNVGALPFPLRSTIQNLQGEVSRLTADQTEPT